MTGGMVIRPTNVMNRYDILIFILFIEQNQIFTNNADTFDIT